jgi:DNA replication protein DnaC
MAYAKLSGALLAYNDARPAPTLVQNVSAPCVFLAPAAAESSRLAWHLKALKLPVFLDEHDNLARQCSAAGLDVSSYLLRLAELELVDRKRRSLERRIKGARFPAVKGLDSFDLAVVPSLVRRAVLELARCEYVARPENIILIGNSGTGKTRLAVELGLAACRKGLSVRFTTAALLVHELQKLIAKRDDYRLMVLQRRLAAYKVLIIDELGYEPLSTAGAELLFEVISQRSARGSTIIASKLPIDQWSSVFGTKRLTDAVLDRLTNGVRFLEMDGESYSPSSVPPSAIKAPAAPSLGGPPSVVPGAPVTTYPAPACAENGSCYRDISKITRLPNTKSP